MLTAKVASFFVDTQQTWMVWLKIGNISRFSSCQSYISTFFNTFINHNFTRSITMCLLPLPTFLVLSCEGRRWRGRGGGGGAASHKQREIGGEKLDLGCRKKRGVSSDTTDCSSFLLPATYWRRRLRWWRERGRWDRGEELSKDGDDWEEVRRAWDMERVTAPLPLAFSKRGHVQG